MQSKCRSGYHISCLICDDAKGGFDKDREIGDGIFGMNISKQSMREKNCKDHQKPQEEQEKPLKFCS